LKIEDKKRIVDEMHESFSRAKVVIATDYKGLDVGTINELRGKLHEAAIEYKVVKNTLLARASEDTGVAKIKDVFKGPTAVALSFDDPVAPAKILSDFAKDHEKLEIKAGVMDGAILDLNAIKALSALPSRDQLLGQMLSVINGVPTNLVRLLNAIPVQFLNVLQAIKEQKEAA